MYSHYCLFSVMKNTRINFCCCFLPPCEADGQPCQLSTPWVCFSSDNSPLAALKVLGFLLRSDAYNGRRRVNPQLFRVTELSGLLVLSHLLLPHGSFLVMRLAGGAHRCGEPHDGEGRDARAGGHEGTGRRKVRVWRWCGHDLFEARGEVGSVVARGCWWCWRCRWCCCWWYA